MKTAQWLDTDCEFDSARDHPLVGNWLQQDSALLDSLNLPLPKSRKHGEARDLIVTEAIMIGRGYPGRWTSYSRRPDFYAKPNRYRQKPLTHATVLPTVDELARLGWFDHQKSEPGQRGWQSRFRASDRLMALAEDYPTPAIYGPREIIVLRDGNGKLVDYDETDQAGQMCSRLAEINEAIKGLAIVYAGVEVTSSGVLILPHSKLPVRHCLHRIFNRGTFSLGGRLYGGTWQNIPKEFRPGIEIDEGPTIEHDHPRLHPTLLYGLIGQKLNFDPYDVPGFDRPLAKMAFNTLVNAETEMAAQRSIAGEIKGLGAYAAARELILALKIRNPAIRHLFGSGLGLRLQRLDSDMAERVQQNLLRRGVVALPVHDSHIVPARHQGLLIEAMEGALDQTLRTIGGNVVILPGCNEIVPQYGDGHEGDLVLPSWFPSALVPSVRVLAPPSGQRPRSVVEVIELAEQLGDDSQVLVGQLSRQIESVADPEFRGFLQQLHNAVLDFSHSMQSVIAERRQ
jgi:hypothetical protein